MRCSPDGRLLYLEEYDYYNGLPAIIRFYKVVYPSEEDQNYYLTECNTLEEPGMPCNGEMSFLCKMDGLLWFCQIFATVGPPINRYQTSMAIYAFDGKHVVRFEHPFPEETLINFSKSRSWLSENIAENIYGWSPGWRDPLDFEEILPLRSDESTPCYLPKNVGLVQDKIGRIYTLTQKNRIAQFEIKFSE